LGWVPFTKLSSAPPTVPGVGSGRFTMAPSSWAYFRYLFGLNQNKKRDASIQSRGVGTFLIRQLIERTWRCLTMILAIAERFIPLGSQLEEAHSYR
jgi:hypothetical protein